MPTPIASLGWFRNRGTIALPGYFIAGTPWSGMKVKTTWGSGSQDSTHLGGGWDGGVGGSAGLASADHYLNAGTFSLYYIYAKQSSLGIATIKWGSTTLATVDQYQAGGTVVGNFVSTTASLTVAAGNDTFSINKGTKNASSSDYTLAAQTYALIRTGA